MKKGQNTNRPAKGSQIKVHPIIKLKDIKAIKRSLVDKPRDFCLFVLGINTNLRASDLTQITVGICCISSVHNYLISRAKPAVRILVRRSPLSTDLW
jgi:hypothetical protein